MFSVIFIVKVRVFTYAVGPPAHSVEALRSIACQNRGKNIAKHTVHSIIVVGHKMLNFYENIVTFPGFFYRIPGVGSVRDAVKVGLFHSKEDIFKKGKSVTLICRLYFLTIVFITKHISIALVKSCRLCRVMYLY